MALFGKIFRFCSESGRTVERYFRVSDVPDAIEIDREIYVLNDNNIRSGKSRFPYECVVSGVHANQAQELRDFYGERKFPIEISQDGNPIYTSRKHRSEALKLRGMVDRGSYS